MPVKKTEMPYPSVPCHKCGWTYSSQKDTCPMCGAPLLPSEDTLIDVLLEFMDLHGIYFDPKEAKKFIRAYKKQMKDLPSINVLWESAVKMAKLDEMADEDIKKLQDQKRKKEEEAMRAKMEELRKEKLLKKQEKEGAKKEKQAKKDKEKELRSKGEITCAQCGNRNPLTSTFCLNCGANLGTEGTEEITTTATISTLHKFYDGYGKIAAELVQQDKNFVKEVISSIKAKNLKATLQSLANKAVSVRDKYTLSKEGAKQLAYELFATIFDSVDMPMENKEKMCGGVYGKIIGSAPPPSTQRPTAKPTDPPAQSIPKIAPEQTPVITQTEMPKTYSKAPPMAPTSQAPSTKPKLFSGGSTTITEPPRNAPDPIITPKPIQQPRPIEPPPTTPTPMAAPTPKPAFTPSSSAFRPAKPSIGSPKPAFQPKPIAAVPPTISSPAPSVEGSKLKCSQCGEENPADSAFCLECGNKLS